MFRLAVAYDAMKEYAKAQRELMKLLHYEKTNSDAVIKLNIMTK